MSAPTNFQVTCCNIFWKIQYFHFFLWKTLSYQIWPCRKIGHGQPRVIIYIKFVELESPMLHAKFQDHRTSGSGEEDFLRFLPYMGVAAILVMWPRCRKRNSFPLPKEAPHKIWLWSAKDRFSRRRCLSIVEDDRRTEDGLRTMGIL